MDPFVILVTKSAHKENNISFVEDSSVWFG